MQQNPTRRSLLILVAVMAATLINSMRYFDNPDIRLVEILSFIALGMAIGAFVTRLTAQIRQRRKSSSLSNSPE